MTKRLPEEPRWLSEATVLAVHAQLVERYGGRHGVRDEGILYSLITKPRQRWNYDENADLASLASAYLTGMSRAHAFVSGNKRTALACALLFLEQNHFALTVPALELLQLVLSAASGERSDTDSATILRRALTTP